jgi:hypothetical protein
LAATSITADRGTATQWPFGAFFILKFSHEKGIIMGWLFGHYTRASLVEHLKNGNGVKTLKNCFVGNNMWAVQEYTRGDETIRFICLYMLQGNGRIKNDPCNWGYKDVSEDMGPYQLSCPLGYIEMVEAWEKENGVECVGHAKEWRANVRERVANSKRKLVDGSKISLYGRLYTVDGKYHSGKYRLVCEEGAYYAMKKSQIKDVQVLA